MHFIYPVIKLVVAARGVGGGIYWNHHVCVSGFIQKIPKFVTKLGIEVHHHGAWSNAEKLGCYLQGQGESFI